LPAGAVVERKTVNDLLACIGRERERFERELKRGRYVGRFIVIVEGTSKKLSVSFLNLLPDGFDWSHTSHNSPCFAELAILWLIRSVLIWKPNSDSLDGLRAIVMYRKASSEPEISK
jgi:hypothetical protein